MIEEFNYHMWESSSVTCQTLALYSLLSDIITLKNAVNCMHQAVSDKSPSTSQEPLCLKCFGAVGHAMVETK